MGTYPDSYDVLELLMPMFSGGGKDEYGKDVVPPIPLLFDRVNEGRPPTSNSLLFRLPFEILGVITLYLSGSSLAALSLVSKDCCQLARSRRFDSVQFNYSVPQSYLIKKLLGEVRERAVNRGSTISPSIGACFRRLRIATNAQWISHRLKIDLGELNDMDKQEKEKRIQEAHSRFFKNYLPAVELILTKALPHLELLDMQDHIPLPLSFFNALACSSIQHLKLYRVTVSEEFEIALPRALAHQGWRLRTLHLELYWRIFGERRGSTAPLCTSLLCLCAPTLEKFTWVSLIINQKDVQSLVAKVPPRFVQLRELSISHIQFSDDLTLKLLIFPQPDSRLKVLEMGAGNNSLDSQFLERCGTIRSLETFVWNATGLTSDQSLAFFRHNSHLSKLRFSFFQPPALLDEKLLPILSHSFQDLKSLSLTWDSTSISNSALELIGTLRDLQQLHLSAGSQSGWRHDWFIKHQEMRDHLRKLPNLRKLAFSGDTYETRWGLEDDYYSTRIPTPEEILQVDVSDMNQRLWQTLRPGSKQIWEQQHRQRILKEADGYAQTLPRLEWMYFGQLPMGVNNREAQGRQAVGLTQERDDCWTLLRRMFGRDTADS